MLVLHLQANRAPRELVQVDILEAVGEAGPGSRLQGSQHRSVVHAAHSEMKQEEFIIKNQDCIN